MSDESAAESGRIALRVTAVVLLILVVLPFVVTGVPSVVGAKESYVVLSGSMNDEPEPVIHPGDVVIVDDVNPSNVEEQDIITFTNGGEEPVTHRVVNVTQQDGQVAFRTKGDANEDADPQLVGGDQIIGEVVFVIPLIGHVVNFANTTQGFVLLVLLPIGLLVLSEAWNLVMAPEGSSDDEDRDGGGQSPSTGVTRAAEPNTGVQDTDDGGSSTVTLQKAEAKWIAVGLVPIVAATGYASFRLQSAWILTLFFASVGLCLLCGLLYLRMIWGAAALDASDATAATDHPNGDATPPGVAATGPVVEDESRRNPIVRGRIEQDLEDDSYVEVSIDSREELVAMAIEKGTWVVYDTEVGTYVLVDGGMLFRYEGDGTTAIEPGSEWEEASGWLTFPEDEGGETRAHGNGSGADGQEDEAPGETTDDTAGPAGSAPSGASDTAESPNRASSPVDADSAASDADSGESTSAWSDDVTPAIRRIDEGETAEDGAASAGEGPTPARSEGGKVVREAIRRVGEDDVTGTRGDDAAGRSDGPDQPATGGSVKTDGGTTAGLPGVVGAVERLVTFPIRALGFVGYLVLEPLTALYRATQADERRPETGSRSDGRTGEERADR